MTQPKGPAIQYEKKMGAHLNEDERVRQAPLGKLNVYTSDFYEIDFYVYPRIAGNPKFEKQELICALVTYKSEGLRIMVKMGAIDTQGAAPIEAIRSFIDTMEPRGQSPLLLVRQAKTWCNISLTNADMITLSEAGIEVDSHA